MITIDGHAQPGIGQQIVIPAGVEGLAAGVYTLLPAEYALMNGAFRVELGSNMPAGSGNLTHLADGSTHLGVTTSIANTDIRSALKVEAILTPAKVVRTYSQYNETSFGEFLLKAPASAQPETYGLKAAANGVPRADLVVPDGHVITYRGTLAR